VVFFHVGSFGAYIERGRLQSHIQSITWNHDQIPSSKGSTDLDVIFMLCYRFAFHSDLDSKGPPRMHHPGKVVYTKLASSVGDWLGFASPCDLDEVLTTLRGRPRLRASPGGISFCEGVLRVSPPFARRHATPCPCPWRRLNRCAIIVPDVALLLGLRSAPVGDGWFVEVVLEARNLVQPLARTDTREPPTFSEINGVLAHIQGEGTKVARLPPPSFIYHSPLAPSLFPVRIDLVLPWKEVQPD